jgi:hypothetical protein
MIFNRYVFLVALTLLLSGGAMLLVLTRLDPFQDKLLAIVLFYLSLFFFVSSLTTLLGYVMRVLLYPHEMTLNHFNVSLRQGMILAMLVVSLLIFQSFRRLFVWDAILLFLIAFLVEIYFVAKD